MITYIEEGVGGRRNTSILLRRLWSVSNVGGFEGGRKRWMILSLSLSLPLSLSLVLVFVGVEANEEKGGREREKKD